MKYFIASIMFAVFLLGAVQVPSLPTTKEQPEDPQRVECPNNARVAMVSYSDRVELYTITVKNQPVLYAVVMYDTADVVLAIYIKDALGHVTKYNSAAEAVEAVGNPCEAAVRFLDEQHGV